MPPTTWQISIGMLAIDSVVNRNVIAARHDPRNAVRRPFCVRFCRTWSVAASLFLLFGSHSSKCLRRGYLRAVPEPTWLADSLFQYWKQIGLVPDAAEKI